MRRTAKIIPSHRHEAALPLGKQTKGFAAALRKHTNVSLGAQCRIVPDAFEFDLQTRTLTIYEIQCTHEIAGDLRKLEKLRLIRDFLVTLDWRFNVLLCSPLGDIHEIDWATGQPDILVEALHAAIDAIGALR